MVMCVPLMIVNLAIAWIWLMILYLPFPGCNKRMSSINVEYHFF